MRRRARPGRRRQWLGWLQVVWLRPCPAPVGARLGRALGAEPLASAGELSRKWRGGELVGGSPGGANCGVEGEQAAAGGEPAVAHAVPLLTLKLNVEHHGGSFTQSRVSDAPLAS